MDKEEIDKQSRQYNQNGLSLKKQKKYDEAIAEFDKSIQLKPKKSVYYYNKARALKEFGKFKQALQEIKQAIKLSPNNHIYQNSCGLLYFESRKYGKSIIHFDKAIEIESNRYEYYLNKSISLFHSNQYNEALNQLKIASSVTENKKEREKIKLNKLKILNKLNNTEKALKLIDKLILDNSEDKEQLEKLFFERVKILKNTENKEKAILQLNDLIQINKNVLNYYLSKIEILFELNKLTEGLEELKKIKINKTKKSESNSENLKNEGKEENEKKNNPFYYLYKSIVFLLTEEHNKAIYQINKSIKIIEKPDYQRKIERNKIQKEKISIIYYMKAMIILTTTIKQIRRNELPKNSDNRKKIDFFDEAIFYFKKTIKLNDQESEFYYHYAIALEYQGNFIEALEIIEKAIELSNATKEYYLFNRGICLYYLNNHKDAIYEIDKAIQLNPNILDFYKNKASIYKESNKLKLALQEIEKVLAKNPVEIDSLIEKGYLLATIDQEKKRKKEKTKINQENTAGEPADSANQEDAEIKLKNTKNFRKKYSDSNLTRLLSQANRSDPNTRDSQDGPLPLGSFNSLNDDVKEVENAQDSDFQEFIQFQKQLNKKKMEGKEQSHSGASSEPLSTSSSTSITFPTSSNASSPQLKRNQVKNFRMLNLSANNLSSISPSSSVEGKLANLDDNQFLSEYKIIKENFKKLEIENRNLHKEIENYQKREIIKKICESEFQLAKKQCKSSKWIVDIDYEIVNKIKSNQIQYIAMINSSKQLPSQQQQQEKTVTIGVFEINILPSSNASQMINDHANKSNQSPFESDDDPNHHYAMKLMSYIENKKRNENCESYSTRTYQPEIDIPIQFYQPSFIQIYNHFVLSKDFIKENAMISNVIDQYEQRNKCSVVKISFSLMPYYQFNMFDFSNSIYFNKISQFDHLFVIYQLINCLHDLKKSRIIHGDFTLQNLLIIFNSKNVNYSTNQKLPASSLLHNNHLRVSLSDFRCATALSDRIYDSLLIKEFRSKVNPYYRPPELINLQNLSNAPPTNSPRPSLSPSLNSPKTSPLNMLTSSGSTPTSSSSSSSSNLSLWDHYFGADIWSCGLSILELSGISCEFFYNPFRTQQEIIDFLKSKSLSTPVFEVCSMLLKINPQQRSIDHCSFIIGLHAWVIPTLLDHLGANWKTKDWRSHLGNLIHFTSIELQSYPNLQIPYHVLMKAHWYHNFFDVKKSIDYLIIH